MVYGRGAWYRRSLAAPSFLVFATSMTATGSRRSSWQELLPKPKVGTQRKNRAGGPVRETGVAIRHGRRQQGKLFAVSLKGSRKASVCPSHGEISHNPAITGEDQTCAIVHKERVTNARESAMHVRAVISLLLQSRPGLPYSSHPRPLPSPCIDVRTR